MCGRFAITTARFTRIEGTPRHDVPGGPPPLQHLSVADHPGHPRIRRWSHELVESRRSPRPPTAPSTLTGVPRPRLVVIVPPQGPRARSIAKTGRGYIEHYQFRFPVAREPRLVDLEALVAGRPRTVVDERGGVFRTPCTRAGS